MMNCKTNQSKLVRCSSIKVFNNFELWLGAKSCWITLSKRKVFFYVIVLIHRTLNENLSSSALSLWKPQINCFERFLTFCWKCSDSVGKSYECAWLAWQFTILKSHWELVVYLEALHVQDKIIFNGSPPLPLVACRPKSYLRRVASSE